MKILSNDQYDLMINTIRRLKKENRELKTDLSDLQNFCMRFANDNTKFGNAYNLDFPNSKKSYEDKIY